MKHPTQVIAPCRSLAHCESGATLILVSMMFLLLLASIGIVVDIGRTYAVQSKAQNAADAALLGAVATISTTPVNEEMTRLFDANYPTSYMGSTVGTIGITEVSSGVFQATFTVTVPTVIMQFFGAGSSTINILSEVTRGLDITLARRLELALVLDNTGSMAGSKIEGLKQASKDLTDILFGSATTLANLHISVIPYDVNVNIGTGHRDWVQPAFLPKYDAQEVSFGKGFVSNRNSDSPKNTLEDVSDNPPTTDNDRFRVPSDEPNIYQYHDITHPDLAPIKFGMNVKTEVYSAVDAMKIAAPTRINVGMMWGWFAVSPKWRGIWDPGKPDIPADPAPILDKAVVLMTDGNNTVFNGIAATSVDNNTTRALCTAAKAQGIIIYTVGFGGPGDFNPSLLQFCASKPGYFFHAPTAEALRTAFKQIGDDLIFNTLRLSH